MADSQIVPTPRDGAPVVVVAVDGVPMTWIGETPEPWRRQPRRGRVRDLTAHRR